MPGRVVLLVTSPRLPAGVLTAAAWDLVRAHRVLAFADAIQLEAVRAAGGQVEVVTPAESVAAVLAALAQDAAPAQDAATEDAAPAEHAALAESAGNAADAGNATVVWLVGPGGDEEFARELGLRLAREPAVAELELCYGSWDPPGARLLDVVTVMDRLAGPGGDPWKREQTHQSLGRYLLEEAYEAYDAIEGHDLDALKEELGDVLLQVVLHARMAEEAEHPWTIDDLAGLLVDKLIRRNPHVFGDDPTTDVAEIVENWERIKTEEKSRESAMDGIALSQPALALAAKVISRARRAGLDVPLPATTAEITDDTSLGLELLAIVAAADANGLDAEAALRRLALRTQRAIRSMQSRASG